MKNYFMQEAIKEARKAQLINEVPVGAVIVKDDIIIGRGFNKKEISNNPMKHAEIVAIENACENIKNWRLNDTTIYITQEPCAMCAGAIIQARIKKVVYGVSSPKSGHHESIFNILQNSKTNHICEVEKDVCKKEIEIIMREFFKQIRSRGGRNGN